MGADEHDNVFYFGGWITSGVIVIGDLGYIAATIRSGDLIGTSLNLADLIPGSHTIMTIIIMCICGRKHNAPPDHIRQGSSVSSEPETEE